jgi:hypothetical protein
MEPLADDGLYSFLDGEDDALLWRALEAQAVSSGSDEHSAPQSLEAWAPPSRPLRCVDATHPADCTR